jgi:ribonucleotide reductase alpha subunit
MDISQQVFSDIIIYNKYAKYIPALKRRETWEEICDRNAAMHLKKFPQLEDSIRAVYTDYVKTKKVLPSMRSMQFGGRPIELNHTRIYNCCLLPVDNVVAFGETMFLLLGGTGVGYSVQKHHIEKLPVIQGPKTTRRRYLVSDSIEGWGDAVKMLLKAYAEGRANPDFDFRDIRPKGATLVTAGGKAPGPEPLRICLENLRTVLNGAVGRKLTTLECHDMQCHIADAVLSGGIRRAAMIAFFSHDDLDMVTCKSGAWWELNPQRGRANNSAVLHRDEIDQDAFQRLWQRVEESNAGEPGVYWTNDKEILSNPCFRGDMELLTSEGYKRIDSLVGKEFLNVNKDGNLTAGKVWSTGVKPVVEVRFRHSRAGRKPSLYVTPNHTFMLNDGTECEAKDLAGKRLMPYFTGKAIPRVQEDFKAGFMLGDACLTDAANPDKAGIVVCIGENDVEVADIFGVTLSDNHRHYLQSARSLVDKYGLPVTQTFDRQLGDNRSDDFLMGLYSANGCVIASGKRVALKTTSKLLAQQVVEWLQAKGMTPYVTTNKAKRIQWPNGEYESRESYDVNLAGLENLIRFAEVVSFVHGYKREALAQAIRESSPTVSAVLSAGEAEVFDFTEPETHWGIVNGVVAHNCVEATLRMFSFCNLTTVNASDVETQDELNKRVAAATLIGTLQASYTDFHYLRDEWKKVTEEDALIGVSMTGIGSGRVLKLDLTEAARIVVTVNKDVASLVGINTAARTSLLKPEGTASIVVGSSSGIHAWHAPFYRRRMRLGKNEPLYAYVKANFPELVEDCHFKPHLEAVLTIPQKAPEGSILRDESFLDLLERVRRFNQEWIAPGHNRGVQKHNVSCTISLKPDEWEACGEWMWKHRNEYNGISVLPYDGGTYIQAPFEDCTEEEYNAMMSLLHSIDLTQVIETDDATGFTQEAACAGGQCEVIL